MSPRVNMLGVFCEDIREEKQGTDSLIGIMPDNITIPGVPGIIPKIGVYLRCHISTDNKDIKLVSAKLVAVEGKEFPLGSFGETEIERERENAVARKAPLIGFIFRGVISPMPIPAYGQMALYGKVNDDDDFVCAVLNLMQQTP